jgi:hypothetical protein
VREYQACINSHAETIRSYDSLRHHQARQHDVSSYSPLCLACGLILCSINQPQYACPYCSTPLLTAAGKSSWLRRLETQIADVLTKEAEDRERAAEEARKAAGAFPTLAGASSGSVARSPVAPSGLRSTNQPHKVLSLNSKTKVVTVSSYTTPAPSRPVSRTEPATEVIRVPPPPGEVIFARKPLDPARPWADLKGEGAKYVSVSRISDEETSGGTGRQGRRSKGKEKV